MELGILLLSSAVVTLFIEEILWKAPAIAKPF